MKFIAQIFRNIFFSQKWFQDMYFGSYFTKVNGNWRKYVNTKDWVDRKFNFGEKIQKTYNKYNGYMGTLCQNDKCGSLVTVGSTGIRWERSGGTMWSYECSCCGKAQCFISQFTPLIGKNRMGIQKMIPCDENANVLKTV